MSTIPSATIRKSATTTPATIKYEARASRGIRSSGASDLQDFTLNQHLTLFIPRGLANSESSVRAM